MQTVETMFSDKKTELLEWILAHPTTEIKIRQTSKILHINAGYISTVIKELQRKNIVKKNRINLENPNTRALKILFNIQKISSAARKLKNKSIVGVGVYGSWAKGTNIEDSDLDLWIKTTEEISVEDLSRIRGVIREQSGAHEVSLIVLTEKRIEEIKSKDQIFYSTLLNSFGIEGEFID